MVEIKELQMNLNDGLCPICDLMYVKGNPDDERQHRSRRRMVLKITEPKPEPSFAKFQTEFIPATTRRLSKRLYQIAWTFKREMRFDFVQWSETGDDGRGYLMVSDDGRVVGGFVVRWHQGRRRRDGQAGWSPSWIWVARAYRRQGWLRRTWSVVVNRYPGIEPEGPLSEGSYAFFRKVTPQLFTAV
jgi:hypothetical protein